MRLFLYLIKKANRTPVTQELYLDEKTMPHVYVIVSRIYGSYTRSYLLMRKQCLNVYVIVHRIYDSYTRLFLNPLSPIPAKTGRALRMFCVENTLSPTSPSKCFLVF